MLGKGMTERILSESSVAGRMTGKAEKMAGRGGKDSRKRGSVAAVAAALGLCGCMLAGCGDALQTEEELVIPAKQTEEETGTTGEQAAAPAGSVAAQVQAPVRYQWEGTSDKVSVTADATVVVPDVEGIRTKKVTGRAFTQEDYDRVSQTLLGGSKLWERDIEAMAGCGFTAEELENMAKQLEAEKENGVKGDQPYAGKAETLDEQIVYYRELAKEAPREAVLRDVQAVVVYDASLPEGAEANWLSGRATVDGRDYLVNLDNSLLTGEIRRAVFSVSDAELSGSWNWLTVDFAGRNEYPDSVGIDRELAGRLEAMQLQPETVMEEAKQKLAEMGMEEYVPYGGEYCFMSALSETQNLLKEVGYIVHCSRMEEGVPVIYTHETGIMPEGSSMWWPQEELNLVYTEEGLACFEWVNPWTVEELSAESVFLMPFAEVQNIFQDMIMKKNLDEFSEEGDTIDIQVTGVRLGYRRIQEAEGMEMTASLIPVWNFQGRKICRNETGEIRYVIDNEYESLLTINAMDGTIVE
ncbi:MAG: hypothetical protein K2P48_01925 [Lachnospiraceae bacterium]|nr:hypothetical protein [Lachnospiraceae bacterium]